MNILNLIKRAAKCISKNTEAISFPSNSVWRCLLYTLSSFGQPHLSTVERKGKTSCNFQTIPHNKMHSVMGLSIHIFQYGNFLPKPKVYNCLIRWTEANQRNKKPKVHWQLSHPKSYGWGQLSLSMTNPFPSWELCLRLELSHRQRGRWPSAWLSGHGLWLMDNSSLGTARH